jgi:hypothetical protein
LHSVSRHIDRGAAIEGNVSGAVAHGRCPRREPSACAPASGTGDPCSAKHRVHANQTE